MLLAVFFVLSADAQTAPSKGKNPVIVIPGIMGSKLVNKKTKETVWVRLIESDVDDLSLPVSPNLEANVDDLVPDGILDKVRIFKFLPGISIYAELLDYLEKKSGYVRGDWENPVFEDGLDMYFEFGYDWRRDNVENAHLLLEKIKKLKTKLKKPDLKFDVIGHSMGGLIARYAAMYGTEDLRENQKPNWSGVRHFEKIFLMGTPNEGSMGALDSLIFGVSVDAIAGRYFPKYLSREVVFTIPTLFQLLPQGKSLKIYDDLMQPIKLDIYDPDTWEKYGWSPAFDEKYLGPLDKEKRKNVRLYFSAVLRRARLFHEALAAKTIVPESISFYVYGSDCKDTLSGAIVYFDKEKEVWKTLLRRDGFKNSFGEKISEKIVVKHIFEKGDGTVPRSSLFAENIQNANGEGVFWQKGVQPKQLVLCESHTALPGNKKFHAGLGNDLTDKLGN